MKKEEKNVVIVAALLMKPQFFLDKKLFIKDPNLLRGQSDNEFLSITDRKILYHIDKEVEIGGKVVKVLNVMVCNQRWIDRNYTKPLYRLLNEKEDSIYDDRQIQSEDESCNCSNCCTKQCCKIIGGLLGIIFIISFIIYYW